MTKQYEYSDRDALLHYGVLGMKWGVRKDRSTGQRVGTPAKGTKRAKHSSPSLSPKSKSPLKTADKPATVSTPAAPAGGGVGAKDDTISPKEMEELLEKIRIDPEKKKRFEEMMKVGISGEQIRSLANEPTKTPFQRDNDKREARGKALSRIAEDAAHWTQDQLKKIEDKIAPRSKPEKAADKVRTVGRDTAKTTRRGVEDFLEDLKKRKKGLSHEEFVEEAIGQYEYSDRDALLHYGVLGMKWGVRKDRRTGQRVGTPAKGTNRAKHSTPSVSPKPRSSKKSNFKKSAKSASKQAKKFVSERSQKSKAKKAAKKESSKDARPKNLDKADIKSMSTPELQSHVNRIRLEKEYARLTQGPQKESFAKEIAVKAGKVVTRVALDQAESMLNAKLKKEADKFLRKHGIEPIEKKKK